MSDQSDDDLDLAREEIAEENDKPLGMGLGGAPPGCLEITSVKPGTWAERKHLMKGEVIFAINDEDLEEMSRERFKELIAKRPLRFLIDPPYTPSGSEDEDDKQARLEKIEMLRQQAKEAKAKSKHKAEEHTDAEVMQDKRDTLMHERRETRKSIKALRQSVKAVRESLTQKQLHERESVDVREKRHTLRHERRETRKSLAQIHQDTDEKGRKDADETSVSSDLAREVIAQENDRPLGMGFKGLPPGILEVSSVKEGTWAHREQIQVGDLIVAVNDEDLEDMSRERFKELFGKRPLRLIMDPPMTPSASEDEQEKTESEQSSVRPKERQSHEQETLAVNGSPLLADAGSVALEPSRDLHARIQALEAENALLRKEADAVVGLLDKVQALEHENEQLVQRIAVLEQQVPKAEEIQNEVEQASSDQVSWFRPWAAEPPIYYRTPSDRSHWFCFIRASKIRDWDRHDGPLPRQQDISPDWFVAHEISLVGIFRLTYERNFLVVSHRWETPEQPDPSCNQLTLVRKYLLANPDVKYVWYDYWCLPQRPWQKEEDEEEARKRMQTKNPGYPAKAMVEVFQRRVRFAPKSISDIRKERQSFVRDEGAEHVRMMAFRRVQQHWRSAFNLVKKHVQHKKAELQYLKRSAYFVWCLYVSMPVLILQDRESVSRFWCCWESWLAMQCACVTEEGLVANPSYLPQRDIVVDVNSVHEAEHTPLQGGFLHHGLAEKSPRQVRAILNQSSLGVAFERDRRIQVGVLDRLEFEVPQLHEWFKKRQDPMLKCADEYVLNLWHQSSRRRLFIPCKGETLDLNQRGVDDRLVAAVVAEEVTTNTGLRTLALGSNKITDVGAAALAQALKSNTTLEMLYLNNNFISDAGAEKLIMAVVTNQTLGRLDMEKNRLSVKGKEKFQVMLSQNLMYSFRLRV